MNLRVAVNGRHIAFALLVAGFSCSPVGGTSEADREILESVDRAFQEGIRSRQDREQARPHFRQAARNLEELRRRGANNAMLYRNLGNAYLLADDLPRALLSYHRGLRLSPNDAALNELLAEARQLVVYPPSGDLGRPRREDRAAWMPYVPGEWLMGATLACYVVGCVAATRSRMVRQTRYLLGGLFFLSASALCAGGLLVRIAEERERAAHPLVVVARDEMPVRRGNGMAFPPRYETPLNRGVEGRLLLEREGWVQVELSGGEIGWLPREAVLLDES